MHAEKHWQVTSPTCLQIQKVGVTVVVMDKQKNLIEGVKVTCKLHGTKESCGTGGAPSLRANVNIA